MIRIFSTLAMVALLLLGANFLLGLFGGDFYQVASQVKEATRAAKETEISTRASESDKKAALEKRDAAIAQFEPLRGYMTVHILLGLSAGLATVLVNSITMTYFIGTSRWCKEVVETFRLDSALAIEGQRIKRRNFPWSLTGILSILGVMALGAAADASGANWKHAGQFVQPHYVAAMAAMALIGFSFNRQTNYLRENGELVAKILAEVARVRRERGLVTAEST